MRDLTKSEIREYFEFARADLKAEDYHLAQHQLIGEAVVEVGLLQSAGKKAQALKDAGVPAEDVILSLWVSAFQMGRECESRLLTRARKAPKFSEGKLQ